MYMFFLSGYLQIWLYLKKIFTELIKEISVHLTVMIMKADGTTLLRRRKIVALHSFIN